MTMTTQHQIDDRLLTQRLGSLISLTMNQQHRSIATATAFQRVGYRVNP